MYCSNRNLRLLISAFVAVIGLAFSTSSASAAEGNPHVFVPIAVQSGSSTISTPESTLLSAQELEAIKLTNDLRRAAGCADLVVAPALQNAAEVHSSDMAAMEKMSHTGSDGSLPWDRAGRFGYTGGIGENVAAGYRTPANVVEGWRDSSGHYQNIVNCEYRDIGLALVQGGNGTFYWTQIFGRP